MGMYYTTTGSVRGACGHKHRTLRGAANCLRDDRRWCRKQGGYSDRRVVVYTKRENSWSGWCHRELNYHEHLIVEDVIDNP